MLSFFSVTRRNPHQLLKPCRSSSTLPLLPDTADASSSTTPSVSTVRDHLRDVRFNDLKDSLSRSGNPTRVWSYYTSLLNFLGYEKLPLEIHQQVLRQCTPPTSQLRTSAARRLVMGNSPTNPHIHEGRFQTIIRTMRSFDMKPTLDDYNFILEQFAAVGHHTGAMHVYKELRRVGLLPRTKTFGLCLQAIAHRLTLPVEKGDRPLLVQQTRKMLSELHADMQTHNIPFTSVNLDLTIRILKETLDREGFESLMRWAYGIDLSNPDRPPLEHMGLSTAGSGIATQSIPVPPQPFSTPALNTTIDMLGILGDVSKLIQAFEVLTQPLPKASQHQFTSFDDDDDFGVADGFVAPEFTPPHASPNTTTYNMLLRHLCRGGHATLARHYILEAIHLDRQTDSNLRFAVMQKPIDQILAPHFAINCGTLLSAFGLSNRDKNARLMRWLASKIPSIIRRKKGSVAFFNRVRDRLISKNKPLGPSQKSLQTVRSRSAQWDRGSVLDLNVDAPPETSLPPVKYLDLNFHIQVLERDLAEISQFNRRVLDVLGRTTQRIKERLGRRVWSGKDIYLQTSSSRLMMTRKHWQSIVHFKPRLPNTVLPHVPPYYARDPVDRRGLSTTSAHVGRTRKSRLWPSPPALQSHLQPEVR